MTDSKPYPQWIWGIFYYHPQDQRLLIPIRDGKDHIFNYAKPLAIVLTIASILLPLLGGLLMIAGFVRFFDFVIGRLVSVLVPITVVILCVTSVLWGLFTREDS